MTDDDTGPSEASDIRNLLLQAQLDATLHEAANTIDALYTAVAALESKIDRLNIAGSQALVLLEKAHRAAEGWELLPNCRDYIAQAMEILASDD
jgi:hypothetical protein